MNYIVAGTGSRSFLPDIGWEHVVDGYLKFLKGLHEDLRVMSGMAEGWDEFLARRAIALGIPFIAAVPNSGYGAYYWGKHSQSGQDRMLDLAYLLKEAEEIVNVCGMDLWSNGEHSNFVRNQYMVDRANEFMVFNPTSRGTADTVVRIELAHKPYKVFAKEVEKVEKLEMDLTGTT